MRTHPDAGDRDAVLFAFGEACPRPSDAEVAAWAERHPELAEAIRDHAEALHAVGDDDLEPSPALLLRGRGRALDILATARARAGATAPSVRFADLMAAAGVDLPRLSRTLDIGRAPLVDVVQGRMRLPAPRALVAAFARGLGTSLDVVAAAMASAAASPQMGPAKATNVPSAKPRSFAAIVRADASMTEERKAYWLSVAED